MRSKKKTCSLGVMLSGKGVKVSACWNDGVEVNNNVFDLIVPTKSCLCVGVCLDDCCYITSK